MTPTPASPDTPPSLPGADIPVEPYFPEDTPAFPGETPEPPLDPDAPRALAPNAEVFELLQNPDGPLLQ
jgi:hypothetical protein